MVNQDRTEMGGGKDVFTTTCWTQIRSYSKTDDAHKQFILSQMMGRYWRPVYCYLRRKGLSDANAKDMTQGFFCEVVMGRELVAQASSSKGRFRTFLLTALDRFLVDEHRRKSALKRSPGQMMSLDSEQMPDLPDDLQESSPDHVFCYAWATSLLDEALMLVEEDCRRQGQIVHWRVFEDRVLLPLFKDQPELSVAEVSEKHNLPHPSQVSNMIVTVKRKFKRILEDCIQAQLDPGQEVGSELQEMMHILSKSSAAH